jgi:hypothetical protein
MLINDLAGKLSVCWMELHTVNSEIGVLVLEAGTAVRCGFDLLLLWWRRFSI